MKRTLHCAVLAVCLGAIGSGANAQGEPEVIDKIIDQGKNHSQAMHYLNHLAVEIGPRLTGSSRCLQANAWTRDAFAAMGLSNAHLFKWGDIPVGFDRGVSKVRMLKPVEQEFEFTARSWSAGTNGPVKGPVIKQPKDMEELTAMGDKLKGAWILAKPQQRGRPQRGSGGGGGGPGAGAGHGQSWAGRRCVCRSRQRAHQSS